MDESRLASSGDNREFVLSRTMRPQDYAALESPLSGLGAIIQKLGGWNSIQHPHRRWEYAMAFEAYHAWKGDRKGPFAVADFGCGLGYISPLMCAIGNDVSMYETWTMVNQEHDAIQQMQKACDGGSYRMINRALCGLHKEDFNRFDVSFCISTLEHIGDDGLAFRELCKSVRRGGLLFLSCDFAGEAGPHKYDEMRYRIYSKELFAALGQVGSEMGFSYMGGHTDWAWHEEYRMVHDFGFASLAMVKNGGKK